MSIFSDDLPCISKIWSMSDEFEKCIEKCFEYEYDLPSELVDELKFVENINCSKDGKKYNFKIFPIGLYDFEDRNFMWFPSMNKIYYETILKSCNDKLNMSIEELTKCSKKTIDKLFEPVVNFEPIANFEGVNFPTIPYILHVVVPYFYFVASFFSWTLARLELYKGGYFYILINLLDENCSPGLKYFIQIMNKYKSPSVLARNSKNYIKSKTNTNKKLYKKLNKKTILKSIKLSRNFSNSIIKKLNKNISKKSSKKPSKKPSKKSSKKPSKKPSKKTSKKPSKKPSKKTSKKTSKK